MQTKEENIFKDSFLIGNEYSAFLNRIFIEKHEKQDQSLKQISRGQPRNKGHSKQAIFWWLKN